MKNNSGKPGNKDLLQQFAVKSNKTKIVYGNRAVTYNRCSSLKQHSIEWQEKLSNEYCQRNNWVLVKCFSEKESATTDDRKEFKEMLRFAERENISHIIIFAYDRFSRTGDTNLVKELRKKGIKVHASTQSVDDETPSGRFSQAMYLLWAEMENELRREKVVEGLKNKLRKGEWPGNPPIGYEKRYVTGKKEHDFDKRQCFINKTGELLQQAFHWKDRENLSNVEVIGRLKNTGLNLTSPQLSRIFRNPFYCGYITTTLLDNGEIIRGKHEPLVTEEEFLRVNGVLKESSHAWKVLEHNDEMPLKVTVRCGKCGKPLTAYPQKGKYVYYKCPNNGCCVNIRNEKLHKLFADELSKFTVTPQLLPVIKRQLESTYWMLHKNEAVREKPMKDELSRLKNELEAMGFNLVTSKISSEMYQKYSALNIQKIKDIENELENLVRDSSNLEFYLDKALKYAANLLNFWQLLDCIGKMRLQNLIYPNGLFYEHENHQFRTNAVNPIFSAITSISQVFPSDALQKQHQENAKLHPVYLMFASSNFFWQNLTEIQIYINEMEALYPNICHNVTHMSVYDSTGVVMFSCTSDTVGINTTPGRNSPMYGSNAFTGTSNQHSFIPKH